MIESSSPHVVAIVPLAELGDELLVFVDADEVSLPGGVMLPGERILDTAARTVNEQAGFRPEPLRVVYLLEARDGSVVFGVLCQMPDLDDIDAPLRGEFASPVRAGRHFRPVALQEILVEDLRSGFLRPLAHVIEARDEPGEAVRVTW